jgi:tetratricopeptide (TPR) repeat protein
MVDLSLRGQYEEAARLIRVSRPADARDVCMRILRTFPRHVATYALLGQALVRLGRRDEAANLFYRVLGADPESAEAHAGLAGIHERRQALDEALWHYQRAYELAPGDVEVREGYRRAVGLRDGAAPERVTLTRAGLARTYLRGGLYARAVWELRLLLEDEPQRYDLRVALAEALWRSRAVEETATICQSLLATLPNCLKAGLLLGGCWLGTERDDMGRTLLQRAQALDPDNAVAQALFGARSPLPPRAARLPAREDDLPPLDLDYLLADADLEDDEEEPASWGAGGAWPAGAERAAAGPVSPAPERPTPAAEDAVEEAPPEDAAVSTAGEAADEEPVADERPAWESLSLIDVQRQYVAEHPEDSQARLDLARRLRDDGSLGEAIEQYRWLVENEVALLPEAIEDLEFLNRLYPRTTALVDLLGEARFRERTTPGDRG